MHELKILESCSASNSCVCCALLKDAFKGEEVERKNEIKFLVCLVKKILKCNY